MFEASTTQPPSRRSIGHHSFSVFQRTMRSQHNLRFIKRNEQQGNIRPTRLLIPPSLHSLYNRLHPSVEYFISDFLAYCDGVRSACLWAGREEHIQVAKWRSVETQRRTTQEDQMRAWEASWGVDQVARSLLFGFLVSSCFVSSGIALHSPVFSSSSSSNYISFGLFCFVWPRFSLLVLARLCYWP